MSVLATKRSTPEPRPSLSGQHTVASIRSKRCIVPASGFYEWQDTGKKGGKQPYYIHAENNDYLPFAGLYDIWKNPEGQEVYSFTIITTPPTVLMRSIHTRMPAILEPNAEALWLDPETTDLNALLPLLHPSEMYPLELYKVSKAVNRAACDSPTLIQKVDEENHRGEDYFCRTTEAV